MANTSTQTINGQSEKKQKLISDEDALVRVNNLKKHYYKTTGIVNKTKEPIKAVDGVSFNIPSGETFGLVGESGSGKSTVARCIVRLEEATSGTVEIKDKNVESISKGEMKELRQNVQIVSQDPGASLNPKKRIRQIIRKPLDIHSIGTPTERREKVDELITTVGLPIEYKYKYPSELSGGEKQRVCIARALSVEPDLIVLDEPTSALDVSVQSNVLELLDSLQEERNITYFFITHDLALIQSFADWLGVMYLGEIIEKGSVESVFFDPKHPYTRALISAIPTIYDEDEKYKPERILLEGEIPDPSNVPSGCSFRTRCPKAFDECKNTNPKYYEMDSDHYARCLLYDDDLKT